MRVASYRTIEVVRGQAMQDLIHASTDLECYSHLDRQPMQRSQYRCDVTSPSDTVDNASGRVLCSLESVGQSIVQSTEWTEQC